MQKDRRILIIGSGIAGLTVAIKAAERLPDVTIIVASKSSVEGSNTYYAQGGIAGVLNQIEDSFEKHISDTLIAGDGLCDRAIVKLVVEEAPHRLRELIQWGARFDRDEAGHLDLAMEGGHSAHRIIHHKDSTGFEVMRVLNSRARQYDNIHFADHQLAFNLHIENALVCGVWMIDQRTGGISYTACDECVIATGGAGQLYLDTTNPEIATGDGVAMAIRAGLAVKDLEFVQFHPTMLYQTGRHKPFLISEAVRGFGAVLRNHSGDDFMSRYDSRKDLAPRDIVARAIFSEMLAANKPHVFLDCTALNYLDFKAHFPAITNRCGAEGIDVRHDWIPVVPAAHYMCGGVVTDSCAATAIPNLYVCGESACTGLHGANRLASNSLLEALVFAHRCAERLGTNKTLPAQPVQNHYTRLRPTPESDARIARWRRELKQIMSQHAGIVRTDVGLEMGEKKLSDLRFRINRQYNTDVISAALCELRNMLDVAEKVVALSLSRTENHGGYYNTNRQ